MSESAYVLINVLPGQTANVKNLLAQIEEIKTIDACWGKPDIFVKVGSGKPGSLDAIGSHQNPCH